MRAFQIPAFCEHHNRGRDDAKIGALSMKLMVDYFFDLQEVEEIILAYQDDAEGGINQLVERFAPICCHLGDQVVYDAIMEARKIVKWGPRITPAHMNVGFQQFDLGA